MKFRKVIPLLLTLALTLSLLSGAAFGSEPEESGAESVPEEAAEETSGEASEEIREDSDPESAEEPEEVSEEEASEEPAEEALSLTALEAEDVPMLTAEGDIVSGLTIGSQSVQDRTYYLLNAGTLTTDDADAEDYHVYYDGDSSTLTLNGADLAGNALTVPAGTTIVLGGESTAASVTAKGALTIQGNGTLTVAGQIKASGYDLVIGGSAVVKITGTANYGLIARNITIQDSAVVNDGGTGSQWGVYANGGSLAIRDSATVTTENRGVNASKEVSISGSAQVTVTNSNTGGAGIQAGTGMTISSGAAVAAKGQSGLSCSGGDVTLDGSVTATATGSNSAAVNVSNGYNLTVTGSLNAIGGMTGILVGGGGAVSIQGGSVTTSGNTIGINTSGDVTITEGSVTSGSSYGIYATGTGDVTIENNSSVTTGGSYGICVTGGGDVTITGDSSMEASSSAGVYISGDSSLTITDGGSLTSTGYYAVYATGTGDVTATDGALNGLVRVKTSSGSDYTAYGDAALNFNLELSDTTTLTIATGSTLTVSDGMTLSTTSEGKLLLQEGATLALAAGATFSHEGDLYIDFGGVYDDTEGDHKDSADSAVYYQVIDDTGAVTGGAIEHDGRFYALAGEAVTVEEKTGQTAHITYAVTGGTEATVDSASLTVTEPVTVTAVTYTDNDYTVTLNTDGGVINSGSMTGYTYGLGAALPTDVTRTGYTFAGWYESADFSGQSVTAVSATDTGDKTYYARWTINSYTVTWKNADGSILAVDTVNHGDIPVYTGAAPAKAADDKYAYTFAGWDREPSAAAGDVTYTAVFTAEALPGTPAEPGTDTPAETATPTPGGTTAPSASPSANTAPSTGDESRGTLWLAALVLTAAGLAVIAACGRRRKID